MKIRITAGVRPIAAQKQRSSLERHFAQRRERAQAGLEKRAKRPKR